MYDDAKKETNEQKDREVLQLLEMLSRLPETPVPDQFDLRLRQALKEEKAKKRALVWKKWTAVAACLLIGLLSVHMVREDVGLGLMENMSQKREISEQRATESEEMQDELTKAANANSVEDCADNGEAVSDAKGDINRSEKDSAKFSEMALEDADSAAGIDEASSNEVSPEDAQDFMEEFALRSTMVSDGVGSGLDGNSQFSSGVETTEASISRGETAAKTKQAFEIDCEQLMSWIVEGVTENDSQRLAEAMNYKNDLQYSQESAEQTLKLYSDLLRPQESELTFKRVNLTSRPGSNIYRLSGGENALLLVVSNTSEGMKISEPVMERTQWLYQQVGDREFILTEVICASDNAEIEFKVNIDDEVRSFVWKETES